MHFCCLAFLFFLFLLFLLSITQTPSRRPEQRTFFFFFSSALSFFLVFVGGVLLLFRSLFGLPLTLSFPFIVDSRHHTLLYQLHQSHSPIFSFSFTSTYFRSSVLLQQQQQLLSTQVNRHSWRQATLIHTAFTVTFSSLFLLSFFCTIHHLFVQHTSELIPPNPLFWYFRSPWN